MGLRPLKYRRFIATQRREHQHAQNQAEPWLVLYAHVLTFSAFAHGYLATPSGHFFPYFRRS